MLTGRYPEYVALDSSNLEKVVNALKVISHSGGLALLSSDSEVVDNSEISETRA